MRFSNLVEMVDVEEAYRLHKEAVKQSATDPQTGRVDNIHFGILIPMAIWFNFISIKHYYKVFK